MTATGEALKQLNSLLDDYNKLAPQLKYPGVREIRPEMGVLANRLHAAIDRLTVPTSRYAQAAEQQRQENTGFTNLWLEGLAGIATALRDDIAAGWLASVVELAHADTYADYLDMANGLTAQHYKDAAAVIAGTSLEVHLKALAIKHGVSLHLSNGGPKMASALNDDLKREGVYNALEHKQVIAWLAIRNSAAHGNYGEYEQADVKALIEGVGNFAARHPA